MQAVLHLMPLVLVIVVVGASLALWGVRRQRVLRAIDAAFETLRITDGVPSLRGADLQVVADRTSLYVAQGGPLIRGPGASFEPRAEYYFYCVGPGPSWFLVIALVNDRGWWTEVEIDWIVRPLDAERMRGALVGDDDALRAAGLAADT